MKKVSLIKGLSHLKAFCLFLFLSVLFISCKNFLHGSDTAQRLEEIIALANMPSFNIEIALSNSAQGSILPNGNLSVKATQSYDIEFRMNNDYEFKYFEVIDKKTFLPVDGVIEFSNLTQEQNGYITVIKVKIKVLKQQNDVLIRPKCRSLKDTVAPDFIEEPVFATTADGLLNNTLLDSSYVFESSTVSFPKNHIQNTIFFNLSIHEQESSITSIIVRETPLESAGGVTLKSSPKEYEAQILTSDYFNNRYDISCSYTLQTYTDGYVKLEVFGLDEGENRTEGKSLYVIKDTICTSVGYITKEPEQVKLYTSEELENFYIINPDGSADTDFNIGITKDWAYAANAQTDPADYTIKYAFAKTKEALDSAPVTTIPNKQFIEKKTYPGTHNFEFYEFSCPVHIPDISSISYIMVYIVDEVGNYNTFVLTVPGIAEPFYDSITYTPYDGAVLDVQYYLHLSKGSNYYAYSFHKKGDNLYKLYIPSSVRGSFYAPGYSFYDESTYPKSTDYYSIGFVKNNTNYLANDSDDYFWIYGPITHYICSTIGTYLDSQKFKDNWSCTSSYNPSNDYITLNVNIDTDFFNSLEECYVTIHNYSECAYRLSTNCLSIQIDKEFLLRYHNTLPVNLIIFTKDGKKDSDTIQIDITEYDIEITGLPIAQTILFPSWSGDYDDSGSIATVELYGSELSPDLDYNKKASVKIELPGYTKNLELPIVQKNNANNKSGLIYIPLRQIPDYSDRCNITISFENSAGIKGRKTWTYIFPQRVYSYSEIKYSSTHSFGDNNEYYNQIKMRNNSNLNSIYYIVPESNQWLTCDSMPCDPYYDSDTGSLSYYFNKTGNIGFIKEQLFNYISGDVRIAGIPHYSWWEGMKEAFITDINEITAGMQIYSDVPFFVHTIVSDVDWGQNIDEWEYQCIGFNYGLGEISKICIEGDYSRTPYYYPYPKNIQEGMYYTTIVHYADGTALMGEIRKK